MGEFAGKLIGETKTGELIYDFGQNFARLIRAEIQGQEGQKLIFRHSEVLVDGELFVKSLRTAKATATYICKEGEQVYSPKLTYMGFRYVGVTGIKADNLKLRALVLHSQMEEIGSFTSSNPLLNRLQENIRWGGKSNFVDIPTDCPQRDERQGWTGDIAVFASTACFNFAMDRFFAKWLLDLRSEQSKGGGIPMVVPRARDWIARGKWVGTAYVLPLHFGMTDGLETEKMVANLVQLIAKENNHLGTGFPGTPYLLFALADHGRLDIAYGLLLQETCPSWLYQIKAGGTTIWERWDALRPDGTVNTTDLKDGDDEESGGMVSFNHYAGGAVGDWLYRRVAGIEPLSGGYASFKIAPKPGGDLTWVRAAHLSPFGEIVSEWKIEGVLFTLDVKIPVSTICSVVLPNGEEHKLQSGKYSFSSSYK